MLSNYFTVIETAKILGVFPVAAKSHFAYQESIVKSLHDAGHDVTIICPAGMAKSSKNYTVISVPSPNLDATTQGSVRTFVTLPLRIFVRGAMELIEKYCENFLKVEEVQVWFTNSRSLLLDTLV